MTCNKHVIAFDVERYPQCPLCAAEAGQKSIAAIYRNVDLLGKADFAKRIRHVIRNAGDDTLAVQSIQRIIHTEVG